MLVGIIDDSAYHSMVYDCGTVDQASHAHDVAGASHSVAPDGGQMLDPLPGRHHLMPLLLMGAWRWGIDGCAYSQHAPAHTPMYLQRRECTFPNHSCQGAGQPPSG
jgi:hypothetical protein